MKSFLYVMVGLFILLAAGAFIVAGLSNGSRGFPLVIVGGVVIGAIVSACSDGVKDQKEGIIRNNGTSDYKKILEMKWDIKRRYSDPNCKACQDELRALESRIVHGPRQH